VAKKFYGLAKGPEINGGGLFIQKFFHTRSESGQLFQGRAPFLETQIPSHRNDLYGREYDACGKRLYSSAYKKKARPENTVLRVGGGKEIW